MAHEAPTIQLNKEQSEKIKAYQQEHDKPKAEAVRDLVDMGWARYTNGIVEDLPWELSKICFIVTTVFAGVFYQTGLFLFYGYFFAAAGGLFLYLDRHQGPLYDRLGIGERGTPVNE